MHVRFTIRGGWLGRPQIPPLFRPPAPRPAVAPERSVAMEISAVIRGPASAMRGRLGSLNPEDYTKAQSIRLELGVDVNAGRSGYKPWRIIVVSQVPKLILEVDHTKIQGSILVVVHATAELVNNAIVGLTTLVGKVPGADQEVPIGPKSAVNVVKFGAEHEGSLFSKSACAVGEASPHRRLTKHEPAQTEIGACGKALIPALGIEGVARWRIARRVVEGGIEVGFHQGVQPIDVDVTSAALDRGHHLGMRCVRRYGSRHENCER